MCEVEYMDVFLTILKIVAGPVLGAVIGYLTNWLAVKMLFRPYNAKKIGKFTLPFTPGIIPKRKDALAKAVGKAVGEQLLTPDDMAAALCSEETKQKLCDIAVEKWNALGGKSVKEAAGELLTAEQAQKAQEGTANLLSDKIYAAVCKMGLGDIVAQEGARVVNEKKNSLGMLSMFLSDDLIYFLTGKLGKGVDNFLEEKGKGLIEGAVNSEVGKAAELPLEKLTSHIDEDTVRRVAGKIYEGAVKEGVEALSKSVDVSAIVEKKIADMDMKELEKLVLSVMKKELNAIVNLGALIGFVLGIIMIFI
jgi:uncharacterized membrane protein YheB (UPF0754 family)